MQNDTPAPKDPNPLHHLLNEQPGLRFLQAKSQALQRANQLLAKALAPDIWQHCQVQNIDACCLVISTNHAAWATHLRYQQAQLLAALHKNVDFKHVTMLRVRVIPTTPKPVKMARRMNMSAQVGMLLNSAADSTAHEGLSAALRRLASHAQKQEC